MFKGTYRHRLDSKGRLPVPAAFRRALPEGAHQVVLTALDGCLAAYPQPEWARLETQLAALPAFSKPVKALSRLLLSRAVDCELDVQGRILIPPALRASAGLEGEVVVIGVLNRFELWATDAWDRFVRESERLLDDVSVGVDWPPAPASPLSAPPSPKPSSTGKP